MDESGLLQSPDAESQDAELINTDDLKFIQNMITFSEDLEEARKEKKDFQLKSFIKV